MDPEALVERKQDFFDLLDIDPSSFEQHNALDDARLLREVYGKLLSDERMEK